MSEDSLRIDFKSEKLHDEKHREELEQIHAKYVTGAGPDSSVDYTDDKACFFSSFYSAEHETLIRLFAELTKKGATDLVARAWHDGVGEESLLIVRDDRILEFESREELDDYLAEAQEKATGPAIDYGKEDRKNVALIRLQVKVEKKRKVLQELFSSLVQDQDFETFKANFKSLLKGKKFEVEWGRFRTIYGEDDYGSWSDVCSDELLRALTDVVEDDKFLLLAFDLDKVSGSPDIPLDDYLYIIFYELVGVSKVWIKYWYTAKRLLYVHHPGMGGEAHFVFKRIPNENDWPQI